MRSFRTSGLAVGLFAVFAVLMVVRVTLPAGSGGGAAGVLNSLGLVLFGVGAITALIAALALALQGRQVQTLARLRAHNPSDLVYRVYAEIDCRAGIQRLTQAAGLPPKIMILRVASDGIELLGPDAGMTVATISRDRLASIAVGSAPVNGIPRAGIVLVTGDSEQSVRLAFNFMRDSKASFLAVNDARTRETAAAMVKKLQWSSHKEPRQ